MRLATFVLTTGVLTSGLLTAGCTPGPLQGLWGQPPVDSLRLTRHSLTVRLSTGQTCRADFAPLERGQRLSGRFADCPSELSWQVDFNKPSYLEPVFKDMAQPYARIRLTDARGFTRSYRTPYPTRPDKDD
ncbi:hypothetical protein [Phaeovulum vinaykumarii]|uniref:Lipoprotein n=1 Tax=Phaeovulum vinaykumarii TaxID=407234 RepID=A0A1N7L1G1_9RHOB|nr:hypothetical protein [Phaeovulum vinaykumarii]SIS67703.1 hypothetical protein SAMN05421795_102430 [Phaeovulum vinaykumarii]SOC00598.1 hypothetical protein SAMN05878426_102342 [Phaeovulum vinaykumarii]